MSSADKTPDRSVLHLANERTFLAWLRTSIVIIGLGFVIAKFSLLVRELGFIVKDAQDLQPITGESSSVVIGGAIVIFGVALIVYAMKNYLSSYKAIESGRYVSKHSMIYLAGIGLIIFGIAVIAYLVLLFV